MILQHWKEMNLLFILSVRINLESFKNYFEEEELFRLFGP